MHSHDRTLLASLGFADPDRKDSRHTLACQYLAQPEVSQRLLTHLHPEWCGSYTPPEKLPEWEVLCKFERPTTPPYSLQAAAKEWLYSPPKLIISKAKQGQIEVAITKERGFLVGFWDVVIEVKRVVPTLIVRVDPYDTCRTEMRKGFGDKSMEIPILDWQVSHRPVSTPHEPATIYIEVKASRCDVGLIARQMELYMAGHEYGHGVAVRVVATCWPMSAPDKATLAAKGIHHIRLGAPFDGYVKQREQEKPADDREW